MSAYLQQIMQRFPGVSGFKQVFGYGRYELPSPQPRAGNAHDLGRAAARESLEAFLAVPQIVINGFRRLPIRSVGMRMASRGASGLPAHINPPPTGAS